MNYAALLAVLKRRRWLLITGLTLLAVYGLVGFLVVPRIATNLLTEYVQGTLHRQLRIGQLTFNPFTLTAEVRDFALTESDGQPIASFALLRVNTELSSLIYLAPTFKEIRLEEPHITLVVLPDGNINLAQLIPPGSTQDSAKKAAPPALRINTFALQKGRIDFEDRTRPEPFTATLQPLTFGLANFRTTPDYNNAYSFAARTADDESLQWSGYFSVLPLRSAGSFSIGKLAATTIAEYLQDQLPFRMPSGRIDIDGKYELTLQERADLRVQLSSIRVAQLSIAAKTEEAPWVSVPSLEVENTDLSLADRAISIAAVKIDAAQIDAWRESSGKLNLLRLAGDDVTPNGSGLSASTIGESAQPLAKSQSTNARPTKHSSDEWTFKLGVLQISNATLRAEDRTVVPTASINLSPINVKVEEFSVTPQSAAKWQTSVVVNQQGKIDLAGSLQIRPLAVQLSAEIRDLDLLTAQPYLNNGTHLDLRSARMQGKLQLAFREKPEQNNPRLEVSGDVQLQDVAAFDTLTAQQLVGWRSLQVAGLRYTQSPDLLDIQSVAFSKPYARVAIAEDGQLNLALALQGRNKKNSVAQPDRQRTDEVSVAAPTAIPAKTVPMPMRIRRVTVDNGDMLFADNSVRPSFAAGVTGIKGHVVGLSSAPQSRASVDLSGSVDRYAPVAIVGTVNLLSAQAFTDLTLRFSNMELTTFNPYSGKFAGYNIEKGKLSTDLHYLVQDRTLDAKHHIVVDQLEFGAATESKDAVPLPIKFAVALLKDKDGVITLDLPVNGTLDDPEFRIGPVVWQMFRNLLKNVTTAPFAAIGRLFGGGEELEFVEFSPGSSVLSETQLARLHKLKQALVAHPELQLDVPLTVMSDADADALAAAALAQAEAALPVKKQSDPDKQEAAHLQALTEFYTNSLKVAPIFPPELAAPAPIEARIEYLQKALRATMTPSTEQLNALARARAEAVQAALLGDNGVDAARIFLTTRPNQQSNGQQVRMQLKLDHR